MVTYLVVYSYFEYGDTKHEPIETCIAQAIPLRKSADIFYLHEAITTRYKATVLSYFWN